MNLLKQLEQEQTLLEHYQQKVINTSNTMSSFNRNYERYIEQQAVVDALEEAIRKVEDALVVNSED